MQIPIIFKLDQILIICYIGQSAKEDIAKMLSRLKCVLNFVGKFRIQYFDIFPGCR